MGAERKRGISDLLNDSQDLTPEGSDEPPRMRIRLDDTASQEIKRPTSGLEQTLSLPTFLAYPKVSSFKPKPIPFQKPSVLTSFSYTSEHVQEFTDSALRYFVDPPLGSNLSFGYDRWVMKSDDRGRIDALLKAISKSKAEASGGTLPEIGVVSWRGIMTKILTAPYENRDGWELNVMFVNGTLYLEEHFTEDQLDEKNNMNTRQRSQTYYGYAFESYCTSDTPTRGASTSGPRQGTPPGWGGDVNTNVQWCSVVRTKLGDMRMIIGGEVDCVRGNYAGETDTFVELKTSLAIRGQRDEANFERKLLKFYFQSFLLGVPEIVVGFRTPAGVISIVQSFKTIQLPRLVRGKPGAWDPLLSLNWGYQFLTFLKDVIRKEAGIENELAVAVWRAKFVPGSGVNVERLDAPAIEDVVGGEDRVGFLPRWYWDEIQAEECGNPEVNSARSPASKFTGWQL